MNKKIVKILALVMMLIMALTLFGCSKEVEEPETTTTETTTQYIPPTNSFTGLEIDESQKGKRPISVVVENHSDARPQWGIGSSDIICEGEVEGGITRMLWVYSDYSSIPSQIGPLRSARPSFVEFSSFFDSIFIHWGGSHSKADYIGGYETIKSLGIDDIDGMSGGALFGRDNSRKVSSEHTGIMKVAALEDVIDSKGFRKTMDEDKIIKLNFNESILDAGTIAANSVSIKFSSRTKTRDFSFNTEDKLYHTGDWKTDVTFSNLILLKADSKYITTPYNGSTTTYLNYSWTSGTGVYVSNGKACDITWSVDNGVLSIKDASSNPISINKGKSYIGFVSANHEGSVSCVE